MNILGSAHFEDWLDELHQHTGRSVKTLRTERLLATDFPVTNVYIETEDGSTLELLNAFALEKINVPGRFGVFTEHNGYIELMLAPEDRLVQGADLEPEEQRTKGRAHVIPLADCPLCGAEPDIVHYPLSQTYAAECPSCGVNLGHTCLGYSSRIDLANAWNRRA